MEELQVLGDEFDIDQPAAMMFHVPAAFALVLPGDTQPHVGDVDDQPVGIARA